MTPGSEGLKSGFIWQKVHREADGSSCSVPDGGNMEQSHPLA